jgi:hypothetical protein
MIETPCSRSASLQDINSDPGSRVTFSEGAKKLAGLDQTCFAGRHEKDFCPAAGRTGAIARGISLSVEKYGVESPCRFYRQRLSGVVIFLMNRRSRSRRTYSLPASAWFPIQHRRGIFSVCICLLSLLHISHI